ncbi:MAG: hypothetical protein ACXWBP_11700, partial [Limisphaerales bacterium]
SHSSQMMNDVGQAAQEDRQQRARKRHQENVRCLPEDERESYRGGNDQYSGPRSLNKFLPP